MNVNINRRAEKVMNKVNVLGFTKNGKPMVIDQAREVIAAEEGCRNWHVLQARLKTPETADPTTLATRFYEEMLDSFESITELGEQHGSRTLADLIHLQQAILTGSFIDDWGDDSDIITVLGHLPSRDCWMTYVRLRDEEASVEKYVEEVRILAKAWTDDRRIEVDFNAGPWFVQASDDDILKLAECGWARDYPADAVLHWSAGHRIGQTRKVFEYLDMVNGKDAFGNTLGFECEVDADQALAWLKSQRPGVYARLAADQEDDVRFVNHYLCECGHEWEDEWDCACNDRCPACNKEIEPYISDDGSLPEGAVAAARTRLLEGRLLDMDHSIAEDPSQP